MPKPCGSALIQNQSNMCDIENFPEYGKECRLLTPYKGYRYAIIVDRTECLFIVEISSGASFQVYPDEIEILD